MEFLHFFSYTIILLAFCECCENWLEKTVSGAVVLALLGAHLYFLGEIQFTSTAAVLAVAGYLYLIVHGERGRSLFFISQLLAFQMLLIHLMCIRFSQRLLRETKMGR